MRFDAFNGAAKGFIEVLLKHSSQAAISKKHHGSLPDLVLQKCGDAVGISLSEVPIQPQIHCYSSPSSAASKHNAIM